MGGRGAISEGIGEGKKGVFLSRVVPCAVNMLVGGGTLCCECVASVYVC